MAIRLIFTIIVTSIAGLISYFDLPVAPVTKDYIFFGIFTGIVFISTAIFTFLEYKMINEKGKKVFIALIGMVLGAFLGSHVGTVVIETFPSVASLPVKFILQIIFVYLGFVIGWFKSEELDFTSYGVIPKDTISTNYKILDTSVIIDGRIADIAETGFLEGVLVVPKFVLKELQQVADSSDPLKRSRGRRGLDILNTMKASKKAVIKITDKDFHDTKEVDSKLLKLAKHMNAIIITNDFNLNKVAEFQEVQVLNVNELSNAVKPIVLPNEELKITIIKEGKDQKQGIAYLDDGTMIVVDNGKEFIGREVDVVVTSILQTPAGRMIFTQLSDDNKRHHGSQSDYSQYYDNKGKQRQHTRN